MRARLPRRGRAWLVSLSRRTTARVPFHSSFRAARSLRMDSAFTSGRPAAALHSYGLYRICRETGQTRHRNIRGVPARLHPAFPLISFSLSIRIHLNFVAPRFLVSWDSPPPSFTAGPSTGMKKEMPRESLMISVGFDEQRGTGRAFHIATLKKGNGRTVHLAEPRARFVSEINGKTQSGILIDYGQSSFFADGYSIQVGLRAKVNSNGG